jgi:peptidyl-tRNA hydrolase
MPERDPDPFVMYIVLRRSLKLSGGKIGAQCGHAVQYLMYEALPETWPSKDQVALRSKEQMAKHWGREPLTAEERARLDGYDAESHARFERHKRFWEWIRGDHAKVVLGASEEEFARVQAENPVHFPVIDLGYTEVAPNTQTGLGLWPMRKSQRSSTVQALRPL